MATEHTTFTALCLVAMKRKKNSVLHECKVHIFQVPRKKRRERVRVKKQKCNTLWYGKKEKQYENYNRILLIL
jgi:hypothetical protein